MYEKILQKLKTQRGTTSNVTDRSLEDLAKSLVTVITTDEILAVADLSGAITSIDGNINHYTAEQIKALDQTKADEVAKKAKEEDDKKIADDLIKAKGGDEVPSWAQSLIDQNKITSDALAQLKGEKITNTRSEQLQVVLKDAPEAFKTMATTNFNQMQFTDDSAFETFKESTKTNLEGFNQLAKEKGMDFSTPKVNVNKPKGEALNPVFEAALKAKAESEKE